MILQNPFGKWIAPLHSRKIKPRQKQLVRIGCAALALTMTVGAVPFLMSHASEGEAVTSSDIASKNDVVSPADASVRSITQTVEPMQYMNSGTKDGINYTLVDGVLTFTGEGELTEAVVDAVKEQFSIDAYSTAVSTIRVEGNIESIGNDAFSSFETAGTNFSITLIIGDSVTTIGSHAFYLIKPLTSVQFGSNLKIIGSYAFSTCSGLRSVSIPDSVTTISDHAFHNCFSLSSIRLGESLTNIGGHAFYDCRGVKNVTIP